jgi:hypothetical protein
VKGPRGYEPIAFSTKEEAEEFAPENDGTWIVQLDEFARTTKEESNKRSTVDDQKKLTPDVERETSQPKEGATGKARKHPDPQNVEGLSPYESSSSGFGHHGRGHHMHYRSLSRVGAGFRTAPT